MRISWYSASAVILLGTMAQGQQLTQIGSSDAADATAYSNSHKIGVEHNEAMSDTINVVFQSMDSVYFTFTTNRGLSWFNPSAVSQGRYPGIDVCHMKMRHLVWQTLDTLSNTQEIYYNCLDDWHVPINVSQSPGQSTMPDLVVDSSGVVHIVWVEEINGRGYIYYRTVTQYVLGDTIRLSDYGTNEATCSYPSISIFWPAGRIYAMWECFDPLCYSPYQIHMRYKEGNTWSATACQAHYLPIRHPSLDYSHGGDTLSFCYEDSTSGNMEATFYGGNGGGYATPGISTRPMVSTVGATWSYLFWQEDSAGVNTIYYHLYYFMAGWQGGTFAGIQETTRFPNVSGAYVIWTQGDEPPYDVWFADFGYPIGIEENTEQTVIVISASPNPFSKSIRIELGRIRAGSDLRVQIYDALGRLVREFPVDARSDRETIALDWQGDDEQGTALPAGVYWCCINEDGLKPLLKVVRVR